MNKSETIYNKLKEQYTDEEIADAMLIPQDMTAEEQQKSNEAFRALRFKLLKEQTAEQCIYSELLRFKFLMEDYINNEPYQPTKSFGQQLEVYLKILNRTKKKLSEDLAVHYSRLSRIINDKEIPNIELLYRLEKHSGNIIPAVYWWKLVAKKQAYLIQQDSETRNREAEKVRDAVEYVE